MANTVSVEFSKGLCTVCEGDGVSSEAFSFCYNCDRVFCVDCNKTHTKFTLDHKVVVGEDNIRREIDGKRSFVSCEVHSKENLDLYCRDHEVALCNVCKHTAHRKCNVDKLSSAFEDVDITEWIGQISNRVKGILENADKIDRENVLLKQKLDQNSDEMRNKIEHLRTELNGVLDRYREKLETQYIDKSDVIANNRQACKGIGEHLGNREDALERSKGNRVKEILTMIQMKKLCKDYEYSLEDIQTDSVLAEINVSEDDRVPSLIQQIGTIAYRDRDMYDSEEVLEETTKLSQPKSFLNIKACSLVKEIDIKMINDTTNPNITGCCFLPDDRVVLCDNANKKIKFLDKDMNVKYDLLCSDSPWDVDCQNENCIAVTLPNIKTIHYIDIKPGIKLNYKHQLYKTCYGIAVHGNYIIVSVKDSGWNKNRCYWSRYGIEILNEYGKHENFFEQSGSEPKYVCLNETGSKIHFSGGSGTSLFVTCLTKDGYALYSVRAATLDFPKSMICDAYDNLIVCDSGKRNLRIIDSKGVVADIVMSLKDELIPQSMCLNKHNDMLVVASGNKTESKVTAYKLEYE